MCIPHPIPYQGSKRALAGAILACFPAQVDQLIEPFAGSVAVSLAAAHTGAAQRFVINDINAPLIDLWHAILTYPHHLADQYAQLWHAQHGQERTFYQQVRAAFNQAPTPHLLLFLLVRCVKAAIRYNARGEFNQSADHRRRGTHPATLQRHLVAAAALLHGRTTLLCQDYRAVLQRATPTDLIYLDPPYQGVCSQRDPRYVPGFETAAFAATLGELNQRRISYIVSYDGRTGSKTFGDPLPATLELTRIEVCAGRSSQATLLGRDDRTYESLYLSPALIKQLPNDRLQLLRTAQFFGKIPSSA